MTTGNAVRLAQKTGGLFDTAVAEKATFAELENELEKGDLWEGIDLSSCTPGASGILLDENSLDQFMDLSQFLTQEPMEMCQISGDMMVGDTGETNTIVPPLKLKRSSSVVSDHDYVSKKPRISEPGPSTDVIVDETPAPSPEDKYKERRRKNNIASRRSREIRKQKFINMEVEADTLEVENRRLEQKIVEMERLAKDMKAVLVKCMVNKK